MLSICAWVCSHALGHKKFTNRCMLQNDWLSLSRQIPTINSSSNRGWGPFPYPSWNYEQAWFCIGLMRATALPYSDINIPQPSSSSSSSYVLSVPIFHEIPWDLHGGRLIQIIYPQINTQQFMLCILTNYESLYYLQPTAKRSFYVQIWEQHKFVGHSYFLKEGIPEAA